MSGWRRLLMMALGYAPLLLLALVLSGFGIADPRFLAWGNLLEIVVQSAAVGIVATGMTIVLLTGGIDLSVGSIMFVVAGVAGKLMLREEAWPVATTVSVALLTGVILGAINAGVVSVVKMLPFVVTLSTLYVYRGFGLWMTGTRAMNMPDPYQRIGYGWLGPLPIPVIIVLLTVTASHVLLAHTPFGRQVYALGADPEGARKAGIRSGIVLFACYVLSGLLAAVGAVVSLAQLGAVSPKFGDRFEFDAIAAAVLGGTSLFGGRGGVWGTLIGAILIRAVYNGLVIVQADPYIYPLITSSIIFIAVLIDVLRTATLQSIRRTTRRHDPSRS